MSLRFAPSSPAQQALRVMGVTVVAWGIKLPSAHAVARRAPHGYIPARALRRQASPPGTGAAQPAPRGGPESFARPGAFLAAALAAPPRLLAHSW